METQPTPTTHRVRIVTAASLFDGHDAAINIIRRLLQKSGAEVIHLGHDRRVTDVVDAAIEEDAQGLCVSSYQGGHMEYFCFARRLLDERGAPHIRIFGGGGGVILPEEIAALKDENVATIYSPEDGRTRGLQGIINDVMRRCDFSPLEIAPPPAFGQMSLQAPGGLARALTFAELASDRAWEAWRSGGQGSGIRQRGETTEHTEGTEGKSGTGSQESEKHQPPSPKPQASGLRPPASSLQPIILGITGTGGAGKSSLCDELLRRWLLDFPELKVAVLAIDPTRRKTGGALLGDRIRMNSLGNERVFLRSMATRGGLGGVAATLDRALLVLKAAQVHLIIIETAGIGQGDAAIAEFCDRTLYVMTADYGAPSQLEKIEMLEAADFVALNKFDRRGALDALRDVRKQVRRNRPDLAHLADDELPVFATHASQFGDAGVNTLSAGILRRLPQRGHFARHSSRFADTSYRLPERHPLVPPERSRALAEIAKTCRDYRAFVEHQAGIARRAYGLALCLWGIEPGRESEAHILEALGTQRATSHAPSAGPSLAVRGAPGHSELIESWHTTVESLDPKCRALLAELPELLAQYRGDENRYEVRGKTITVANFRESLAGLKIPKVALPKLSDWGDWLSYLMLENVPGRFPYTAGVFEFKRGEEDPTRMFAGEGPPERTNARFHYLSEGRPFVRLSTAFDSVTLYGADPDERPDIFGKIGESGVSICTLDDMKRLYAGFDLSAPNTSVSMTINGPAPVVLAMYLNTAVDQAVDRFTKTHRRPPDPRELARLRAETLTAVRGTVQADILKEDQAQNTCIFSTEFALKLMGDVQQFFIDERVRNFYSVSISGYHIAEAGANPVTQTAFTLANGFTYVEYYLSRGLAIDDFAPNLSFFFSNGLDPEYTVIGRVARRIWAVAMEGRYAASERAQKLKYHIQTSGRSLHAQEIDFNDIRTTLQALLALSDNAQSLHTNSYDEAITTPTEESVRRALAIQMICSREFGLLANENPLQGAYLTTVLTDLVEAAILEEFDRLSERGGVLGAMESGYQRAKIQEESLLYEERKESGELPIVGVNTFLNPKKGAAMDRPLSITRATIEEKQRQLERLREFQARHAPEAPAALEKLRQVALAGGNVFAELLNTVRVASLGQITGALFDAGGQYRRGM